MMPATDSRPASPVTPSAERQAAFMAGAPLPEEAELVLDTFSAVVEPVDRSRVGLLHELSIGVFWPHRPRDLELFVGLGQGYIALDAIGRPLGSSMYFPVADNFAMLGMMVTTPRLQSLGAGRRLLQHIMQDCAGRDLRLSATRSGYRLYVAAGFDPVGLIWQHQGIARPFRAPEPLSGLTIRPLEPEDHAALMALDAHAYGATRTKVMDALLAVSKGVVAERGGAVCGYALRRSFGKGELIGPVVAEDDATAMRLVAPLIQACEGKFTRMDTPQQSEPFKAFLAAAGLGVFDTVTEMYLGRQRRAEEGPLTYGLAAHSLG